MTVHQRWTQTDLTELRLRVGAGDASDKIAYALSRSLVDVRMMMSRLRLRSPVVYQPDV